MPTVIGVIFFCCGVYCFLSKDDSLLGLLIVAAAFQAASAINISERGIQPYYVVAVFVIARALINWVLGIRLNKSMPQGRWLLLFGVIGVASAFILPVIFAGTPVYDPKIGIDDGLIFRPPLKFGFGNITQAAFLACHVATAYSVLAIDFSSVKARKAYIFAFYVVALIIAAQSVCQVAGVEFPHSLIRNNPGYSLQSKEDQLSGTRNPGTFSEPSGVGAFLALYCVGFLAEYLAGKGRNVNMIASLLATGLVAASGSLVTIGIFVLVLLVRYFPLRLPWFLNVQRTKRLLWITFVLVAPLTIALVSSSGYRETLTAYTVSKGDSLSFVDRTAADLYALQLLRQTHWIGVGLGSNRASSLIATLASNMGIVGLLAFGVYYFRLFYNLPGEYAWLKWAAFALLLNMCVAGPDITSPTLWVPMLLAVQFTSDRMRVRRKMNASNQVLSVLSADSGHLEGSKLS
jgi:hypothetical protein